MPLRICETPPDPAHVAAVLDASAALAGVPVPIRSELGRAMTFWYLPGGEPLLRPGDRSDAVWVVLHGRVREFWDLDRSGGFERDEAVEDVGQGGLVGSLRLLADAPVEALVVAARDSELGRVSAELFWELAGGCPELVRALAASGLKRVRAGLWGAGTPEISNIAVVPADRDAPLRAFSAALSAALGQVAPLRHVTREVFDTEVGAGAADDDVDAWDETDRRVVAWISDQERRHRLLLYEADLDYSPWTRRVVRMADRVLVVARAAADPALTAGEEALFGAGDTSDMVPKELVLIHPDGTDLPSGTHRWMRRRPQLERVHHVRLGVPSDFGRLARLLTGRAIGVVLGGGGARGTAHIGAVQALRDAGIPVDRVGGTSAGGGIAAQVALGWDVDHMRRANRHAFVTLAPFRRYTVPYHSLVSKAGVEASAIYLYGDATIEDLWTPFFCVSCDLVAGRMVVHERGELVRAILATTALPGVFPPVVWDRQLLVDGGVMDNNPVAVMRGNGPGPVVVIDVGQAEAPMLDERLAELPSNLEMVIRRFNPFARRYTVPTAIDVVMRTMTVGRPSAHPERDADLYVRPAVERFGMTAFDAQEQMITIGYNATMDALEAKADDADFVARFGLSADGLRELPRMEASRRFKERVVTGAEVID